MSFQLFYIFSFLLQHHTLLENVLYCQRKREQKKQLSCLKNVYFYVCETEIFPSSVVSWFVSKCIIISSVEGNAGEICSKIGCTGPDSGSGRVKGVPAGTVSYIMRCRTSTVISLQRSLFSSRLLQITIH